MSTTGSVDVEYDPTAKYLTPIELERLEEYRRKFVLIHNHHFNSRIAGKLLFMRWLVETGRVEAPNLVTSHGE